MTKEDEILTCLREHRTETRDKLEEQGKLLARLEERTENQNRRMDRMDRRAAGAGAVSGALASAAGVILARIFGWPGSA